MKFKILLGYIQNFIGLFKILLGLFIETKLGLLKTVLGWLKTIHRPIKNNFWRAFYNQIDGVQDVFLAFSLIDQKC